MRKFVELPSVGKTYTKAMLGQIVQEIVGEAIKTSNVNFIHTDENEKEWNSGDTTNTESHGNRDTIHYTFNRREQTLTDYNHDSTHNILPLFLDQAIGLRIVPVHIKQSASSTIRFESTSRTRVESFKNGIDRLKRRNTVILRDYSLTYDIPTYVTDLLIAIADLKKIVIPNINPESYLAEISTDYVRLVTNLSNLADSLVVQEKQLGVFINLGPSIDNTIEKDTDTGIFSTSIEIEVSFREPKLIEMNYEPLVFNQYIPDLYIPKANNTVVYEDYFSNTFKLKQAVLGNKIGGYILPTTFANGIVQDTFFAGLETDSEFTGIEDVLIVNNTVYSGVLDKVRLINTPVASTGGAQLPLFKCQLHFSEQDTCSVYDLNNTILKGAMLFKDNVFQSYDLDYEMGLIKGSVVKTIPSRIDEVSFRTVDFDISSLLDQLGKPISGGNLYKTIDVELVNTTTEFENPMPCTVRKCLKVEPTLTVIDLPEFKSKLVDATGHSRGYIIVDVSSKELVYSPDGTFDMKFNNNTDTITSGILTGIKYENISMEVVIDYTDTTIRFLNADTHVLMNTTITTDTKTFKVMSVEEIDSRFLDTIITSGVMTGVFKSDITTSNTFAETGIAFSNGNGEYADTITFIKDGVDMTYSNMNKIPTKFLTETIRDGILHGKIVKNLPFTVSKVDSKTIQLMENDAPITSFDYNGYKYIPYKDIANTIVDGDLITSGPLKGITLGSSTGGVVIDNLIVGGEFDGVQLSNDYNVSDFTFVFSNSETGTITNGLLKGVRKEPTKTIIANSNSLIGMSQAGIKARIAHVNKEIKENFVYVPDYDKHSFGGNVNSYMKLLSFLLIKSDDKTLLDFNDLGPYSLSDSVEEMIRISSIEDLTREHNSPILIKVLEDGKQISNDRLEIITTNGKLLLTMKDEFKQTSTYRVLIYAMDDFTYLYKYDKYLPLLKASGETFKLVEFNDKHRKYIVRDTQPHLRNITSTLTSVSAKVHVFRNPKMMGEMLWQ